MIYYHRRCCKWLPPTSIHSCASLITLRYTRCNIAILKAATARADVVLQFLYRVRIWFIYRTFQVSPEKSTVYEWNPHTIQELKDNISHSAAAIKITMLHRVYLNMIRRAQLCVDARGNHLQHLLWRYILSAFGYCINVLYLRCATDLSYFFVAHPVL